jgi:WD40 repeat protein
MMAASYDGGLYLWNAASPDALREFTIPVTGRTGPVSEIEFAQGGERLIVARRGPVGGLWQWDVDSGEYLGVSVPGYGEPATAARSILSQNGELNIVSRADRVLEFRETMDGRLIRAFGIDQLLDIDVDEQPFSVEALAFSEVHRAALICVCFNAAREMRILLLGEEGDILFDYTFYLSLIFTGAVSSDGSLLALGDVEDGDIYIVDVATGEQSITLRGHWERIHDLQFNFNDTLLVSTSLDGTLRLWGIPAGE